AVESAVGGTRASLSVLDDDIETLIKEIQEDGEQAKVLARQLRRRLDVLEPKLRVASEQARRALGRHAKGRFAKVVEEIDPQIAALSKTLVTTLTKVDAALSKFETDVSDAKKKLEDARASIRESFAILDEAVANAQKIASSAIGGVKAAAASILAELNAWPDALRFQAFLEIERIAVPANFPQSVESAVESALDPIRQSIEQGAGDLGAAADSAIRSTCGQIFGALDRELLNDPKEFFKRELLNNLGPNVDEMREHLQTWERQYDDLAGRVREYFEQVKDSELYQAKDAAMRLYRGYGKGPILPQLEFNRDRLAYIFDDTRQSILMSPAAAIVNDVGEVLNAVGLRVP
ncbi:hypothetical protein ACKGJN_16240, partial [Gillisia sp. Q332]